MRMLIVEDDQDGREMLAELFRQHDWAVTAVGTTGEGIDELRQGGFDVVISDEDLVGESGSGMLREAFSEGLLSSCEGVMMYTAEPGRLDVPAGVQIVRKPLGFSQLLSRAKAFAAEQGRRRRSVAPPPLDDSRITPPPISGARPTKASRVELVLYVTDSPSSQRALANLEKILEGVPKDRVSVDIHHLDQVPADSDAALDRVTATPMLVKRGPGPQERFVGDLDSPSALAALIADEGEPSSRVS